MLKLSATRKRLFGFIILGWVLLLISDRIGERVNIKVHLLLCIHLQLPQ